MGRAVTKKDLVDLFESMTIPDTPPLYVSRKMAKAIKERGMWDEKRFIIYDSQLDGSND